MKALRALLVAKHDLVAAQRKTIEGHHKSDM